MQNLFPARLRLLAFAAVLVIGATGNVPAQIIAIKLVGANPGYTLDTVNDSTGVVATTGWQNVAGQNPSASSLLDTAGNTTGASFSLTGASATWGAGVDPSGLIGTQKLLGSWNEGEGTTITLALTNIPFTQYDIYIYGGRQASDRTTPNWSVSDGVLTFSGTAQGPGGTIPTTFTALQSGTGNTDYGDYAVFTSETSSNLNLTIGGPLILSAISGFEIVNTSPVPEPSTWLLVGLSFLGLFLFKRRNLISGRL